MRRTARLRLAGFLLSSFIFGLLLQSVLPQLSGLLIIVALMVLYVLYLSALRVVKRRKNKKEQAQKALRTQHEQEAEKLAALLQLEHPSVFEGKVISSSQPHGQAGTEPTDEDAWPAISVVVPAHNEATVIAETVRTLLALDYPNFTLWIMDDRSQDGTAIVLQALEQELADPRLHCYRRPDDATPGKSAVLNDALRLTTAPYLAVFDADARVKPEFLKQMLREAYGEAIAGVQAQKTIANAQENLLTRLQQYEYTFDAHLQACRNMARSAVELRGNGQLLKRTALEAVQGWNEASVTDDLDLSTRLHLGGWGIRFAEQAVVYEEGITDFWSLVRQRCRWAEGSLQRYLDYGSQVLFSPSVTLRVRADMVGYLVNFLFPLWVATDYGVVMLSHWAGTLHLSHVLLSAFIGPIFLLSFFPAVYHAIRRFGGAPRPEAVEATVLTIVYMALVWVPVVYYTVIRALFFPSKQLQWHKTTHKG